MIFFALWAAIVLWTVWNHRMVSWAILCLGPLCVVSISYYLDSSGEGDDPFGTRLLVPLLFLGMSLVTAISGILSMVLTHHALPIAEVRRREKTLWQRLFWSRAR